VKDVIAKAKPAECVTNPYAGQTEDEFKHNFGWGGFALEVAALLLGGPAGWVAAGAGIVAGAISFAADEAGDEEEKRAAEATAARAAEAAAAAAEAAAAKALAALASPSPTGPPVNQMQIGSGQSVPEILTIRMIGRETNASST
jgi:hypothetical protein